MSIAMPALQQTLIFLPLALGIYLSYKVLNTTDLTVDGTFVLGAAVFARLVSTGHDQTLALLAALTAGAMAGIGVAIMQKVARINSLIASILAVFMLYSVNFQALGRPNISLLDSNTFLSYLQTSYGNLVWYVIAAMMLLLMLGLCMMLHRRFGLLLRAFGSNPRLLKTMGKPVDFYLIFGLALSNAMAAFCGVITAQINGYADINMGLGMALTAIGAVVIGQQLVQTVLYRKPQFNALVDCVGVFLGAFVYFLAMNAFLAMGINPIHLKFLLGLVLVFFLGAAHYSRGGINDDALAITR